MRYQKLQEISRSYIERMATECSNPLSLLENLHIDVKNEEQCGVDFINMENPLNNYPAFLRVDKNGHKTVYYKSNTRYWKFYLMHEAAHCILGHTKSTYNNEIEADLLACMLIKPAKEIIGKIMNAYELHIQCNIPIDKADMYWNEIYDETRHKGVVELMDMYATMGKLLEQMKSMVV